MYNYQPVKLNTVAGSVIGRPTGLPAPLYGVMPTLENKTPPPLEVPGSGLKRSINYYADYAGCGWWRMIAPELLLNVNNKCVINGLTTMVLDEKFYSGITSVRLQRQATPTQLQFIKLLKHGAAKHNYKVIYEIDDIIFKDDIPDYNRCKVAFESDDILKSCVEMMQISDEISVTCQHMKDYYMAKTGNKNITVIPNYPAKMWMDNHYDFDKIMKSYSKNKKKPRIAYIGSGTHIDVLNKTNQKDDFSHVVNNIIATRKDIQWVFIGCFPLPCKPYIDRGEMEFIQWFPLMDLWKAYANNNIQAVYAPLQDNIFNRSKSNIKFLEAACCGIPAICQDIVTYKDSLLKFSSGSDLIDQVKALTRDEQTYMKYVKKSRDYANTMWLDDHIDEFAELYNTRIGEDTRVELIKLNPDQIFKK